MNFGFTLFEGRTFELSEGALEVLLLFGNTYLCEKIFSAMTVIKSKYQNHLQVIYELHCLSFGRKSRTNL